MGEIQIVRAKRKAFPMLIGLAGPSGSGKTYSALLMAAGIIKAQGKGEIGMIDAENGRGEMYADDPGILKVMPRNEPYLYTRLDPPFSPARYVEYIQAHEKNGVKVLVIDSTSHEWEGLGGCSEIAEKFAMRSREGKVIQLNWAKAKIEHRNFANHCLASPMTIIFCFRAREKVEIAKDDRGRLEFIPRGWQPISEKNTPYEMLLSFMLDADTHFATPYKELSEPLKPLFNGLPRLVGFADGENLANWNNSGAEFDLNERLKIRAGMLAESGLEAYKNFFADLSKADQAYLKSTTHEKNKARAVEADKEALSAETGVEPDEPIVTDKWSELQAIHGDRLTAALSARGYKSAEIIPAERRDSVYAALVAELGEPKAA